MNLAPNRLFVAALRKIKQKLKQVKNSSYIRKLDSLKLGVPPNPEKKILKILYGPSFSIWSPSFALDRSIAYALEGQNSEIFPIYCDGIQETDCNCIGGLWGGGTSFQKNCMKCEQSSRTLWRSYGQKAIKLSRYLTDDDKNQISRIVSHLDIDELLSFTEDGLPIGKLAKDILVNNFLVASLEMVPNARVLLQTHVSNLLRLKVSYSRIIDSIKPDRVISNDSYYGMWAVMEYLCKERSIPFYSYWPCTKERAAFAYNDASMNLDFREAWPHFSRIDLTPKDKVKINTWLDGDRALTIDTTKPSAENLYDERAEFIDHGKPSILLAANVIWDLAALNKQIVFSDMMSWINETIAWFKNHPDFQLVIKPHPAESTPSIPLTRERVEDCVLELESLLPKNVIILKSSTHLTLNDLIRDYNIKAFVVHTTTPGYEFAARGYKTITTARAPYRGYGFTFDPVTKQDYFELVLNCLRSTERKLPQHQIDLAQKFLKLYQFHYYVNHNLFSGFPPQINEALPETARNKNSAFGYIIAKIIAGKPIVSQFCWPPES
ncbi:MAG: hypothetical protein ACK587_05795 [Cyanobacteriota bacterium]|jgi:hypothetical protein